MNEVLDARSRRGYAELTDSGILAGRRQSLSCSSNHAGRTRLMGEIIRRFPVVRLHSVRMDEGMLTYFELVEPLMMIETHMTYEERLRLFEVARWLPRHFVACEVGSYLGASTSFLAA